MNRDHYFNWLIRGCLGSSKGAHFVCVGVGGGAQERYGGGGWRFSGEEGGGGERSGAQ